MRGEDDGDALFAQPPHHFPHVAAQFDVDAGGRFVQEKDFRLVGERLGDQHATLHAAGERADALFPSCPTARGRAAPVRDGRDRAPCRTGRARSAWRPEPFRTGLWKAPAAPGRFFAAPCGNPWRCRNRPRSPARTARTRPQTMPISVVLPAPFGPSSAKISPARWRGRFLSARQNLAIGLAQALDGENRVNSANPPDCQAPENIRRPANSKGAGARSRLRRRPEGQCPFISPRIRCGGWRPCLHRVVARQRLLRRRSRPR